MLVVNELFAVPRLEELWLLPYSHAILGTYIIIISHLCAVLRP